MKQKHASKLIEADEVAKLVNDGDTVITDGITHGVPEELFISLERSFLETGHPRDLTLIAPGGPGDARGRGIDHFAHKGFIKRYSGSYLNLAPKLAKMVLEEEIEGYIFPLGAYSHLLRDIAARRPGLITHVGLKTFIDPRLEGGKLNSKSREDFVEVITLHGKEWLFYKTFPIDVALIRGTTADEIGNMFMEKEAGLLSVLQMAQAARNSGGRVIAQVERISAAHTLNPKAVRVPGILVEAVVVSRPENHQQTWKIQYDSSLSGESRVPGITFRSAALDHRKVVGRRGVMELQPGWVVNLGAGMSEFVASVVWEEGLDNQLTFTVEAGMIGGVPGSGLNFNTASNPDAIIDVPSQFDLYDGGSNDAALLGFAQIDKHGNINVSKLGNRIFGVGGFLDVATTSKRRIHCGAFTAGDADIRVESGKLAIVKDGETRKFVDKVDQVTVSGAYTLEVGQPVIVITERAVFKLTKEGLMLVEIAPGVDVDKDILAQMEFKPNISEETGQMPNGIFMDKPLNLRNRPPWLDP
ncbi:MAG: acyl CoA:acetate/3-ketoacid CoA transferase [Candidatus Bathyarchaeia archaeon]